MEAHTIVVYNEMHFVVDLVSDSIILVFYRSMNKEVERENEKIRIAGMTLFYLGNIKKPQRG